MKNYKKIITNKALMFVFLFLPILLFSQDPAITIIKKNIDAIRKESSSIYDFKLDSTNEREILQFVRKYETDSNLSVMRYVQRSKMGIAFKSKNKLIRQEIIESFFLNPTNLSYIKDQLLERFKAADFSAKAKVLLQKLYLQSPYDENLIMLCGFANIKEIKPQLRKIIAEIKFNRNERNNSWYAILALTRLGDDSYVDKIIASMALELDEVRKGTVLTNDVAYTKNVDCIKYLYTFLINEERMPDLDGVRGKGQYYYQRVIEYLARYMDDFPIKSKYFSYNNADLEIAKAYLKKYLGIKEYPF